MNGNRTAYSYDTRQRISTVYSYTYDAVGNIQTISKNGTVIRGYSYDELNRITREANHEMLSMVDYTYDNAGNILTKTERAYSGTIRFMS